ncbi:MAG: methyltransferase domain-containing protein [Chloroflexota bacterium]
MAVANGPFDYQAKLWGATRVRLSPAYIQALKLRYCLEDLKGVSGRLLDVGCGGGNMPKAIKHYRADLDVWGVDVSSRALREAGQGGEGVGFAAANGEGLPFPASHFDAVTMFDVLEHIPDPQDALCEVHRVLRPGGLFHLFVPLEKQPGTIYGLLYRLGWKAKEIHCGHIHFFSSREAVELLGEAGFQVQRTRWSFHPFFALVDVAYFTFLTLRGRPVSMSVEGYVHRHNGRPSLGQRSVSLLKDVLVAAGYAESRLLHWLPGGGGHYTAVKAGVKQMREPEASAVGTVTGAA